MAPATAVPREDRLSLLQPFLGAIRKIENKGQLESTRRRLQLASAVFRYPAATVRLRAAASVSRTYWQVLRVNHWAADVWLTTTRL